MLSSIGVRYFKQAVQAPSYDEGAMDIACKCPICGDSKTKRSSKRLHFYTKGSGIELVNCFNAGCSVQNKTIYSFLKEFYPELLQNYRKETFSNSINGLREQRSESLGEMVLSNMSKGIPLSDSSSEIEANCDIEIITKPPLILNISNFLLEMNEETKLYLQNRKLPTSFNGKWFTAKTNFKIDETYYGIQGYLIIPLTFDNSEYIYGFYSRSIDQKDFKTFIASPGFKVWNLYNIDNTKDVFIFEAIFDAISSGLDNIIANLGAKMPKERLDEIRFPIFCLDNDKAGIENSIEYAKKGYRVYVQPNEYLEKDFNELKINYPELDIPELIRSNIFSGVRAITRLKLKL